MSKERPDRFFVPSKGKFSEEARNKPESPSVAFEKVFEKLFGDPSSILRKLELDSAPGEIDSDKVNEIQEDELVTKEIAKGVDLQDNPHKFLTGVNMGLRYQPNKEFCRNAQPDSATMEDMLTVFQADLGNISSEIQTLQDKSMIMNIKLKNRMAIEERLNTVLDGIVISPSMIKKITEGNIDETWLAYLIEMNKKMTYVETHQGENITALKDVEPELEKLRLKASEKIREFLLMKIKSLRIPNTNIQILQQSVLLKYKQLHQFIMERYGEVALEIRQTYVNTMRWYFSNHFERYNKGLQRLQNSITDKGDLIGSDESVKKGGLFGTSKIALKDKGNTFSLGDRINTLRNTDAGVILVHVAETSSQKYSYEALFRSFNLIFIDNASSEYLFIVEFFAKDDKPAIDVAREVFAEIFDPTIKMGLAATKHYIESSYDAVGILLCIRLNMQFALELQRRRVPALEGYINQTNMLLWPRFQSIIDMHVESVKKAGNKLVVKDIHPHYVTRRYAEFAASILRLNEDANDPILTNSLLRVRTEVELLLNKMSTEFSDHKSRYIFLINNYDLVVTILNETGGKSVEAEISHFQQLLNSKISGFVEEELEPHFGILISFVKQVEQTEDINSLPSERFEEVSTNFATTWRQSITSINASVIQHFANFKNGTMILHSVLGQLIIYYTKFHDLLEKRMLDDGLKFKQQPVGVQTIVAEVKKYRTDF
ncbi:11481_t:CDS:10 [Paraglomus brasilianum]|uniref:11481_t:CDS:1 n=1 Tax=Paraglomus brasilianum TaxID=144538 RepID=A0A9N9D2L9_9GLOM|nr:11481_t:CDS:10 [Paraglomus brasilianum]